MSQTSKVLHLRLPVDLVEGFLSTTDGQLYGLSYAVLAAACRGADLPVPADPHTRRRIAGREAGRAYQKAKREKAKRNPRPPKPAA